MSDYMCRQCNNVHEECVCPDPGRVVLSLEFVEWLQEYLKSCELEPEDDSLEALQRLIRELIS